MSQCPPPPVNTPLNAMQPHLFLIHGWRICRLGLRAETSYALAMDYWIARHLHWCLRRGRQSESQLDIIRFRISRSRCSTCKTSDSHFPAWVLIIRVRKASALHAWYQRCQFIKSVGGGEGRVYRTASQHRSSRRTHKNTLNCMFFLGFRSPSLYFCYLLYLKLNGKIASLDKANWSILAENLGLI